VRAEARRQLKQDKFSRTTIQLAEESLHWSVEHKGKLIVAAAVLVAIVAVVFGSWYYVEQQDEKASADFSKAVQVLNAPVRPAGMPPQPNYPSYASTKERATEAQKEFQAIINNYPHSNAAKFARYFLGVTSADMGDYAAAERDLKAAASERKYLVLPDKNLSSLARMALASVYINTHRTQDAIAIYKDLAQNPTDTVAKTTAEIALAEAYQAAGMNAEAKKQYEQIQKESPSGPAGQLAGEKLQAMK
jgi:predicted negative regulator of RcsB-dependent stress response